MPSLNRTRLATTVKAGTASIAVPAHTGFVRLSGSVSYHPPRRYAKVTVRGEPSSDSSCRFVKRYEEHNWEAEEPSTEALSEHLSGVLRRMRRELIDGTWPPRKNYLALCNPTGRPGFVSETCATCFCPFCTTPR